MTTTNLHFDMPVHEPASARFKAEVLKEMRRQAALALFKRSACSAGVAAKMLGMSIHDFLDFLKEQGVPYAQWSPEHAAEDRESLRWMKSHRRSRP